MIDPFDEHYAWYPEFDKINNPIPRPQPIDAVISYFGGKRDGLFMDVGAYDGITWSNSAALEKYYNWKGVCVEPNPNILGQLISNRNVTCEQLALTFFDGSVDFVNVSGYAEMLSGISTSMPDAHFERIKHDVSSRGGSVTKISVKAQRAQTLFDRLSITKLDYMSIDVECGELNVLKGIDWDRTEITLISCEINEYSKGNGVPEYLNSKGYINQGRVCGDEFFTRT
jgi:FkbM family methyltransferase